MAGHIEQVDTKTLWGGNRSPFSLSYGKIMMWMFLVSDALTFSGFLVSVGFSRYTSEFWPIGEEVFNAMPLLGGGYPLIYVALMTFILIVSSVTMVLAVEAGHRMNKKSVINWLMATVVGGFIFLGSQAWEWSHFIHGSHYGSVTLADGSWAYTKDDGHKLTELHIKTGGSEHAVGEIITGDEAIKAYNAGVVVQGANLIENEYAGPEGQRYADFFFFVTGFHGFHVFTGVMINLIILIQVIRGVYHRRGHYEMVEKAGLYWHFVDLVWVFVFTFFYLI